MRLLVPAGGGPERAPREQNEDVAEARGAHLLGTPFVGAMNALAGWMDGWLVWLGAHGHVLGVRA